jgi:hypothetical protein
MFAKKLSVNNVARVREIDAGDKYSTRTLLANPQGKPTPQVLYLLGFTPYPAGY